MESSPDLYRMRMWIITLVLHVLGVCLVLFFFPQELLRGWKQFVQRYLFSSEYVRIQDQSLSNIVVSRVKLTKPGYVELVLSDGMLHTPGENGVGYSQYLPAGEYVNIPIEMDPGSLDNMPFTRIAPGAKIFVVVHTDNGDQEINPDFDPVARDTQGEAVSDSFTIL